MVFEVIEDQGRDCRVVETFGFRAMAEDFIAQMPKAKRPKYSIREKNVPTDSPALHYPYLPGVGH